MKKVKPTWLVITMDYEMVPDKHGYPAEFKTERSALSAAKKALEDSCDSEHWIFRLTHIAGKPKIKVEIDPVQYRKSK